MLVRMPGFDDVADELYGLPPEQFTAGRTRHEKEAKAAGERDLAARIHGLAKPSVTAWLANQLAREHRDELQPLLDLGGALRDATRDQAGDQLRALSRQQHQLVYALVQRARQLARAAGRNVSDDATRGLADTLHAALADEEAASLLLAARLTEALHSSGFGSGFGSGLGEAAGADVIPISRKSAGSAHDDSGGRRVASGEQRRRAEQELAHAGQVLADATAALDAAQAQATEADAAAAAAAERLEELRQQLEEASTAASDVERLRRGHASALQRAERAVRNAERKAADARDRLDMVAGNN